MKMAFSFETPIRLDAGILEMGFAHARLHRYLVHSIRMLETRHYV